MGLVMFSNSREETSHKLYSKQPAVTISTRGEVITTNHSHFLCSCTYRLTTKLRYKKEEDVSVLTNLLLTDFILNVTEADLNKPRAGGPISKQCTNFGLIVSH